MKKGILYARVSDREQVNGTSLDSQKRACLEYAIKHGIEVVETFVEKGESATAANRTEFLRALDFCGKNRGQIHFFIVWKIDRFARNTTDHFNVRAQLTKYGTVLLSVTEPITQDHVGKLMETFLAGYAEFENEVRKERCTGGMKAKLREGIWCWWPPIGYTHSKRFKDRRKTSPDIPDEARFSLIQRGLRLYKTGSHSITALAKKSNEWGLTTRTGKPMRKQLWEQILGNKFYAGILVNPWTSEEHRGLHMPMISRLEFDQIQMVKRRLSNQATRRRLVDNPDFPLRRFVVCECGTRYTASWSKGRKKRYPFYFCKNKWCVKFGSSVSRDVLESDFCRELQTYSIVKNWKLFERILMESAKEHRLMTETSTSFYQRECARLEGRKRELLEMRVDGEISKEEYEDFKRKIEQKIEALPNPAAIEEKFGDFDPQAAIPFAMRFFRDPAGRWRRLEPSQKVRFQKMVLPEGIVYDKTARTFRTAILAPIFKLNREFSGDVSGLVAGVGQYWNQILSDIRKIYEITGGDHALTSQSTNGSN